MAAVLELERPVAADWVALGCAIRVVVTEPADLVAARCILAAELAATDLACSRFRADSELIRLGNGSGRPTPISPLLAAAIAAALDAAAATDGDVDPTVGSAIADLGYDRDFARIDLDAGPLTLTRRPVPGWRRIQLDREQLLVEVSIGVRLDLGATAKALAADRAAAEIARALDGRGVLVSLGGDIAVAGDPPTGGWSVRVQDVTGSVHDTPAGPVAAVALMSGGLATSSTTARQWVRGGHVMHHILDPRSGVPVVSPWRTVSVAAPSCLEANVASTAAIVRGETALEQLVSRSLPARLVDVDGLVTTLPGWPLDVGGSERVR
jgi:thiamine biosynthesis lipoprotein ApbE